MGMNRIKRVGKLLKKKRRLKRKNRAEPTNRMVLDTAGGKRGLNIDTNKNPRWIVPPGK